MIKSKSIQYTHHNLEIHHNFHLTHLFLDYIILLDIIYYFNKLYDRIETEMILFAIPNANCLTKLTCNNIIHVIAMIYFLSKTLRRDETVEQSLGYPPNR